MKVNGYMVEVELTDTELRAKGTNKASHAALVTAEELAAATVEKDEAWKDVVVIPRGDIAAVENKRASALVNGRVTVTTAGGRQVQLHYRKKSNDDFAQLADQLGG